MKGLLVKDLCLLKNQKKLIPIVVILAAWFTAFHMDSFAFTYMGLMATIIAIGTSSYDEYDRGFTYLFTLPFSRKTYVREKFLLGFLLLAAGMALAFLCVGAAALLRPGTIDGGEVLAAAVSSALICAAVLGVTLPLNIRYGSERGRIAMFIIFAAAVLLILAVTKLLPPSLSSGVTAFLDRLGGLAAALIGAALAAAVCIVGYIVSVRQIMKKEF